MEDEERTAGGEGQASGGAGGQTAETTGQPPTVVVRVETSQPAPAEAREEAAEGEAEQQQPAPAGLTPEQLGRLRETLVAAHPDAVPELIAGETFDALLASVEPAKTAYGRVREQVAEAATGGVPRGGGTRSIDATVYESLSGEGKIAAALSQRREG